VKKNSFKCLLGGRVGSKTEKYKKVVSAISKPSDQGYFFFAWRDVVMQESATASTEQVVKNV
jgi:hypothetical protein